MLTFALDIGTRKVAGLLGELRGDKVFISDAVLREHEKRAMLDGQIHSIEGVTEIVSGIKAALEQKTGLKLEKVTTALAGRNLHTETASAEFGKKGEITRDDISFVELESVRKACSRLTEEKKKDYYCVGFSPVSYAVDGEIIKNPLQHIAKATLSVNTIATFLPKPVLDSMLSVLKNCGLEIESITLEPIAALYVTIPEDMRLLNIALVDVGAGTSDIAITEKGKITAYGMIPKAGDEITEVICEKYLVDFNEAEKIKRRVDEASGIDYRDIFNNSAHISYADLSDTISEKTQEVAKEIADGILLLNRKQPAAVVMVGGGSSLRLLREKVADNLGLPRGRVGSRLPENVLSLANLPDDLKGTEGITPIGILETALFKRGLGFVDVFLNGEKEYIINLEHAIRVIDVLASRGVEMKKLYGKPGNALTFTLNGELKIIRGGKAEHAKILVNNEERTIYDAVKRGDKVFLTGARDGADAKAMIRDILSNDQVLTVQVNGKPEQINPTITVNGREVTADEPLIDRADIVIKRSDAARDIAAKAGYPLPSGEERDIIITLNGEPVVLKQRNYQLKVNGAEVSGDFKVKNMDRIEYRDTPSFYRIRDIFNKPPQMKLKIKINGKSYELEAGRLEVMMNGKKVGEDEFIINGATVDFKISDEKPIISNIFKVYPIDTQRMKGKMLEIKMNGVKAGYTTQLTEGAEIEINFV
jgi:cell division protein FtsA